MSSGMTSPSNVIDAAHRFHRVDATLDADGQLVWARDIQAGEMVMITIKPGRSLPSLPRIKLSREVETAASQIADDD
jgi:hypothetical protein